MKLIFPDNYFISGVHCQNFPQIAKILEGHIWSGSRKLPLSSPESLKIIEKYMDKSNPTHLGKIGDCGSWCHSCYPGDDYRPEPIIISAEAFIAKFGRQQRRL